MVRAANQGVLDYSKFDPFNPWWWKRFYWLLGELRAQQHRETTIASHLHWVTLASHSNLTPESFETAKKNAGDYLRELLHAYYPWVEIKSEKTDQASLEQEFRDAYGYPGDPRYEKMVADAKRVLRKLTRAEKLAARRANKNR